MKHTEILLQVILHKKGIYYTNKKYKNRTENHHFSPKYIETKLQNVLKK